MYIFLGEVSGSSAHFLLRLFIVLLLSFMGSLYILDNKLLSVMSFTNIFIQSVVCLLIFFLAVSFAQHKFLILMKYGLLILSFMDHAFGIASRKSLPYQRLSRFSPVIFCEFYSFSFEI